ncbi:MAG: hypothetical protein U0Q15_01320 [Kineosporiaceae bacterium]
MPVSATEPGAAYGLRPPTLADARLVVAGVYPDKADQVWGELLRAAGITGREDGEDAVTRVVDAMAAHDRVLQLCALSLVIRRRSHDELREAHAILRSAR